LSVKVEIRLEKITRIVPPDSLPWEYGYLYIFKLWTERLVGWEYLEQISCCFEKLQVIVWFLDCPRWPESQRPLCQPPFAILCLKCFV